MPAHQADRTALSDDAVAVVSDLPDSGVDRESRLTPEARIRQIILRAVRTVWLWPSLFMAAMGLWRVRLPEMWQDELVTVNVATRSTRQIFSLLQHVDAVHGAYYLFMHGWIRAFGQSPLSIRSPSILAMTGATACVALLGQRLFGQAAGLAGGFTFAVIPAVTRFAQEARSYAFVVLAVSLATLLLLLAIERSTVRTWAGYAACVAAIGYLNTVALSVLLGHLVGLLVLVERRRLRSVVLKFGLAAVAGALLASRVIYLGTQQATRQINWINQESHSLWTVWPRTFASDWLAWAVVVLLVFALIGYRQRVVFPAAVAVVPVLVIWLVSLGKLNYFFPKYLLFVVPLWAVLAGAGLTAVRWKAPLLQFAVPVMAFAALAVMSVPGQQAMRGPLSHSYYTYPDPRTSPPLAYREAAYIIAKNYRPGDGIGYPQLSKIWWFMHDKGVSYYLPAKIKPRPIFIDKSAADNQELYASECSVPERCFGNEPRVWIVLPYQTPNALGQFADDQRKLLANDYVQVYITFPPGLTVALLQHK